ncbi:hypothetical protein C9I98_00385 [Photobacterium sanctipauli]|uniref:Uncharacterized protein n=1 Tax=Photobacterium sanctipauli TaxID=1342794 RepID=A0A2T3NZX0_9GAMM|nr:hypothetical protein [Photobacterium sanctipauli]PSW21759.1 hypothetical protein C9I98_00385 [Photobacterium sanctipauli]
MKYLLLLLGLVPAVVLACNDERLHAKLMQRQMFEAYLAKGAASVELAFANKSQVSIKVTAPKPLHHIDVEFASSHNVHIESKKLTGIENLKDLPNINFKETGQGFSFIKAYVTAYFNDGTVRKTEESIYLRELKS